MIPTQDGVVSVVIASYNMRDDVIRCLESLDRQGDATPLEVILVDNASSDDTAAIVRERFARVVLMQLPQNVGWTRATNRGIERATGGHILLLNADTVVPPGALTRLVDYLRAHPEAGIVAGRMLNGDGSLQETARDLPGPANALFGRHSWLTRTWPNNRFSRRYLRRDAAGRTEPYDVGWVSAAAAMFPREVVERIGALDESFTHWVDADWCMRISRAGWRVVCVPDVAIYHLEGYGRGKKSPRSIVAFHRGAYRLYRKHYVPSPLHPRSILAAGGLAVRCAWLLGTNTLKRRQAAAR